MNATKEQISAAFQTIAAVAEAIRELKEVPSGHLYAQLMGSLSLDTYQAIIGRLTGAGLVLEENHLLTWIGKE